VDVPVVDNHGQIVSDTKGNQITKSYKAVNSELLTSRKLRSPVFRKTPDLID
jgi:hypothetical protein